MRDEDGGHTLRRRLAGLPGFWYDGQPVDTAPGQDAGSRLGATAAGQTSIFFLREAFALSPVAGPGGLSNLLVELPVNSRVPCSGPGRPFTPFGTWNVSIP